MFLKQQSRGDFARPPTSDQVFISTEFFRIDPGMSLTLKFPGNGCRRNLRARRHLRRRVLRGDPPLRRQRRRALQLVTSRSPGAGTKQTRSADVPTAVFVSKSAGPPAKLFPGCGMRAMLLRAGCDAAFRYFHHRESESQQQAEFFLAKNNPLRADMAPTCGGVF
jgi:hypothetical protein